LIFHADLPSVNEKFRNQQVMVVIEVPVAKG
jgi:hypothetical protein